MAEATPIQIQIDPEGLKAQIEQAVTAQFEEFAMRLRVAADDLDQGKFWKWREEEDRKREEAAYARGLADGKATDRTNRSEEAIVPTPIGWEVKPPSEPIIRVNVDGADRTNGAKEETR